MDFFARPKREGETRDEYFAALQEFVQQCCWKELSEEIYLAKKSAHVVKIEANAMPSVIGEPSEEQLRPKTAATLSLIGQPSEQQLKPKTAAKLSLIGESSSNKMRHTWYKKTGGAADGAGESYEWKMVTLVFLRMLAAGHEFQMASNMEAAGLFDDIVVRYRKHSNDPWSATYLQLKHKQRKSIPKSAFLGLSGDFSLVKYSESHLSIVSGDNEYSDDSQQFIIYTNASVESNQVDEIETDHFLETGGKAVSFKAGGEVYQELCDWVDFKVTLTELYCQVDGCSVDEVEITVKDTLKSIKYQNKAVMSLKDTMCKSPTLANLKQLVQKLESVKDKDTYSKFLAKLIVYTNQAHESELDSKIKKELANVWIRSNDPAAAIAFHDLQARVKSWWQKDKFHLTQDSDLWHGIIKSQTEALSKSTIDGLWKGQVEFVERSLKVLLEKITEIACGGSGGGVLNLRVDSKTTASSLKLSQALIKVGAWDLKVLHVNMKALLEHEDDVLRAWATRWCRLLVLECDAEIDEACAKRISEKISKIIGSENDKDKLLILIAPEKHNLNSQLYQAESYKRFNDNFVWSDLTEKTKERIMSHKVVLNGSLSSLSLAEVVGGDKHFVNKADLEVLSELISGTIRCGKNLDEVNKMFISRRLQESADDDPLVIDSVNDLAEKVVLVVAEPGMGKSTLITHLARSAKSEDPTAWVVHIKLNDCAQYLDVIDKEHFSEGAAKKFLEHCALDLGNSLEKLLLGYLEHKLVVFVDGVDEVCPHYERLVFTLLSHLKCMKLRQLWVASRPVFEKKLEEKLGVKAMRLVPFSEEDQSELLKNVWMASDNSLTREECNEASESLLAWLTNSLGTSNTILGTPLMTAMLAETFQEKMFSMAGYQSEFHKTKRLDVMNLYKTFVKKKVDLYCVEKKKAINRELAANKNDEETLCARIYHNHRLAALHAIFSREEIARLQFEGKETFEKDLNSYLMDVSVGREKIGIIVNVFDGKPHFVHRSFAEYFAASWLASNFAANKEVIKNITFDPVCKLLNEMFNRFLAETQPIHVAVLNRDLVATERILSSKANSYVDSLDDGGRTPLHLAVLLSGTDRHPDYNSIVNYLIKEQKARLDIVDKVLGWVPSQYAERSWAWTALQVILENKCNVRVGKFIFVQKQNHPLAMLDAAKSASVYVVRHLVKSRGGKLGSRGPQGETMIHKAAEGGNVVMLEYLRSKGLSLDIKDNENNTALHYASSKAVQYLVERGLNLEAVNKQGLTPLQYSAQKGENKKMAALCEANASFKTNPFARASEIQLNASLLCAAFAGCLETVQQLVEMGAWRGHQDSNGHTAAWTAMSRENFTIMDWLLLHGSKDGDTTLHGACKTGETEIVSYILSQGHAIDAKGWHEHTPLRSASWSGHIPMVKLLLEKGASVDCCDMDGCTPLHTAASRGHEQVTSLLLRHGANINTQNNMERTPLHVATEQMHTRMVKLLIENGARLDLCGKDGCTSLHTASTKGDERTVLLILSYGADFEVIDKKGRTPLLAATESGHLAIVKLLLEQGASVDKRDRGGRTPLYCASLRGHEKIVALLLGHNADVNANDKAARTPLLVATQFNKPGVMKLLLEKGAFVECRDKHGRTPLHKASWKGYENAVSLLLSHNAKINAWDKDGVTPVHLAGMFNKLGVVKTLLENGADVRCCNQDGFTPLHTASSMGLVQIATLLLSHGADVNAEHNNWTSLHAAIEGDHLEMVELLLTNGASLDFRDKATCTLLQTAAAKGNEQALVLMLDHGANVDSFDNKGRTALHAATESAQHTVVKLLLGKGASIDKSDEAGRTSLYIASSIGDELVVATLLFHRAEKNVANKMGQTPLHVATSSNNFAVVKLLLEYGASAECRDEHGWTPLHKSSLLGFMDSSAILLSHGAKIDVKDNEGRTPLFVATDMGFIDVVTILLEKGADVDCCDKGGCTPLHKSSSHGYDHIVEFLLRHGANVDVTDSEGWTPLLFATYRGHQDVVKHLLTHGANVECRGVDGWTPLHVASWQGNAQIVTLLLQNGADVYSSTRRSTPLHAAVWNKQMNVFNVLLEEGGLLDQTGGKFTRRGFCGFTPLMAVAIKGNQEDVIELLNEFQVEGDARSTLDYINMKDSLGWTALHFSACLGHVEVVRFLINKGGDTLCRNNHNSTALHIAAECKYPDMVTVILEALDEADRAAAVNSSDNDGDSVLSCAALGGCVECVQRLVEAGGKMSQVNNIRRTPLMLAAAENHYNVVIYLLDSYDCEREGLNKLTYITMLDKDGKTALDLAGFESRKLIENYIYLDGITPAS